MEFYEIDFIEAGEKKSGDAIALRYGDEVNPETVHVVDGGYASSGDGEKLLDLIKTHYEKKDFIDHVVLTHPDTDHASGLKAVVEKSNFGTLWMNRPWLYVDELIPIFEYKYTREGLIQRLKKDFPHTAELEEIALRRGKPIKEAFQGAAIGSFRVLAPTKARYVDLIVQSEKTPETNGLAQLPQQVFRGLISAVRYLKGVWGQENLKGSTEGTSRENEMSIIQYAQLAGHKILLTGDAGVEALEDAYQYALQIGIQLPGLTRFQAPHHGGRRNLSSEILDKWLGPKLPQKISPPIVWVAISANKFDEDHPRKSVLRALIHRGAGIMTTEGKGYVYWFQNKPLRQNWGYAQIEEYPEDTEE